MLRVYHSNRLDVLEALMEFIVERQRLDDPFQAEMVLVQSTGMAQWLQMTLAARFGIAANIEFPLPASFIWDMFVRVLKDIPGESAFSKQSMSWKLMTLLPQHLEEDDFILLRQYLSDDGDKRKLFQLAARVADLYDQYLVYRPDWLMRWEAGQRVEGLGGAQQWQAAPGAGGGGLFPRAGGAPGGRPAPAAPCTPGLRPAKSPLRGPFDLSLQA
ncbi:exodeoxyribonuclease V subunit gamma, partial [Klebsiella pneumoniae]|nr:exodeoxyribonuclease V subunit gamma [Klebsiella pneumoniae]